MEIKENESGRTMVEMLGTLAIIGVLSVGGVTGYGRAITAYRANGVAEAAQKAAVRTAGDIQMSTNTISPDTNDAIKTPGTGYVVYPTDASGSTDTNINANAKYFGLVVGDDVQLGDGTTGAALPKEVARNLLEKALSNWKSVHGVGVKVNGGSTTWMSSLDDFDNLVGDNTNVIMIFVYMSDLSLRTDTLFTNLPDGAIGSGEGNEGGDESRTNDDGSCRKGYTGDNCEDQVTCENGGTWTADGCECATGWYGPTCDSDCDGVYNEYGECVSCPIAGESIDPVSEANCSKCPNSYWYEVAGWVCANCPGGFYDSGLGSCTDCPTEDSALSFGWDNIAIDCTNRCPGTFHNVPITSCTKCTGVYNFEDGCVPCPTEGSSVTPTDQFDCENNCPGATWNDYVCSK